MTKFTDFRYFDIFSLNKFESVLITDALEFQDNKRRIKFENMFLKL